jgi:hypothetical protein
LVLGKFLEEKIADVEEILPPEVPVDVLGRPVEIDLAESVVRLQGFGQDHLEGGDENGHDLFVGDPDEADVIEIDPGDVRGDDEAQVVGVIREDLRGLEKEGIHVRAGDRETFLEKRKVLGRIKGLGQEVVDVIAEALVRGHAAGRGVGLGEIAQALQSGHDVPDRRRGPFEPSGFDDRLGTHGPTEADVVLHDEVQDIPVLILERRFGHCAPLDL